MIRWSKLQFREKANVLCTLDRHLRRQDVREYCERRGIQILTDVELLENLRGEDPNAKD